MIDQAIHYLQTHFDTIQVFFSKFGKPLIGLMFTYLLFRPRLLFRCIKYIFKFTLWTVPSFIIGKLWFYTKRTFHIWKLKRAGLGISDPDLLMKHIDALGNGDTYLKGKCFEEFVRDCFLRADLESLTTGDMREQGLLPKGIQGTAGSGEQGVDVVVYFKRRYYFFFYKKIKVAIQCKHYSDNIGNSAVQEIYSALNIYEADEGVVISNQNYTDKAITLAKSNNILLIGRNELIGFVMEPKKLIKQIDSIKVRKIGKRKTLIKDAA